MRICVLSFLASDVKEGFKVPVFQGYFMYIYSDTVKHCCLEETQLKHSVSFMFPFNSNGWGFYLVMWIYTF